MNKVFDLYGFPNASIETARSLLERALGISLAPHESSYRGGDYFRCGDTFVLQRNEELEELMEPDFAGYSVLLYVNEPSDVQEIERALESLGDEIQHLRREQA